MWQLVLVALLFIILGCTDRETFVCTDKDQKPYGVKVAEFSHSIPLTAEEMNKYYFGHPRNTFEVPIKSAAHPLHYFYNPKYAPYTYGGYYQGMETPTYWKDDPTKDGFIGTSPLAPKKTIF